MLAIVPLEVKQSSYGPEELTSKDKNSQTDNFLHVHVGPQSEGKVLFCCLYMRLRDGRVKLNFNLGGTSGSKETHANRNNICNAQPS